MLLSCSIICDAPFSMILHYLLGQVQNFVLVLSKLILINKYTICTQAELNFSFVLWVSLFTLKLSGLDYTEWSVKVSFSMVPILHTHIKLFSLPLLSNC